MPSHLTAIGLILVALPGGVVASTCNDGEPYSHLLYIRSVKTPENRSRKELALHRLSPIAEASKDDAVRRIAPTTGFSNIVGVVDGHAVLSVKMGGVDVIDLQSGESFRPGSPAGSITIDQKRSRLFFNVPQSTFVKQFDLKTKQESMIFRGRKDRPATMGGFGHPSMAVSPDGRWLVVATIANAQEQSEWGDEFEVNVIDLSQQPPSPKRLPKTVRGTMAMTGAGDRITGPALFWADASTFLMAAITGPPGKVAVPGIRAIGNERSSIVSVDARSLERTPVCEIPTPSTGLGSLGRSWRRLDGHILFVAQDKTFRIDLDKKTAVPDKSLSKQFTTLGDKRRPTLLATNHRLAKQVNRNEIFVSPDGKQVVWLTPVQKNLFSIVNTPKNLFHSDGGKATEIMTGQWGRSPMVWLRKSDLK